MKPNFEDYYKIIERCRGSVNEHCSDPIIKELINNDFNNLEQELDETISGSAENPDKYQSVSSDNEDYFQQDNEQFDRFVRHMGLESEKQITQQITNFIIWVLSGMDNSSWNIHILFRNLNVKRK